MANFCLYTKQSSKINSHNIITGIFLQCVIIGTGGTAERHCHILWCLFTQLIGHWATIRGEDCQSKGGTTFEGDACQ